VKFDYNFQDPYKVIKIGKPNLIIKVTKNSGMMTEERHLNLQKD